MHAFVFVGCDASRFTPEQKYFFELPSKQRDQEFKKFPIDKQIDYYLAGMSLEPPEMGLADPIASKGKEALPFLVKRLKEAQDEPSQMDVIYVLEQMHRYSYDLRNEKEVIYLIKKRISEMKPGYEKCGSEKALKTILEGPEIITEQSLRDLLKAPPCN